MKPTIFSALAAVFLSGLVLPAAPQKATSATLHVGVDANITTIQDAVDRADSGDVLLIGAGTYTENVVIDKPLTVTSVSGPDATTVVAADATKDIFRIDAANVTLSGFTVYGADEEGAAGVHLTSLAANCRVTDNRCGKNNDQLNVIGISLRQTQDNTVTGNTCRHNTFGLVLSQSTCNTIKSNNILDSGHTAMIVSESDRNAIHANYCSTSHTVTEDCIAVVNSSSNSLRGNSCYWGKRGIVIAGSEEQAVTGNRVVGNNCNSNSEYGLLLKYAEDSIMRHNWFLHSGQHGVRAEYTRGNLFTANSLANSGGFPMSLSHTDDLWTTTTFFWYTYEGNLFRKRLGNYYDDYLGSDRDDPPDGVGEGIYNLKGYIEPGGELYDREPLVTPTYSEEWGWDIVVNARTVVDVPDGRFVATSLTIPTSIVIITSILRIGGL